MVERCLPNKFPTWRTYDHPESPTYSWKQCAPSLCQAIIIPQTTFHPAATTLAWASPLLRQLMWKSVSMPSSLPSLPPGAWDVGRIPPAGWSSETGFPRRKAWAWPGRAASLSLKQSKTEMGGFTVWLKHRASNWLPFASNSRQPWRQGPNSTQPSRN